MFHTAANYLLTAGPDSGAMILVLVCVVALLLLTTVTLILSRYKRCPSDKILVIYGKVGTGSDGTSRSAKCIHGGAAFIWPIVQAYEFLDLTPMSLSVDLRNALSRQNIRVDVPSRFTVGISTEVGVMQNAAERLLGMKLDEIKQIAEDIIFGQMRLIIATMDIEEINTDRDKFLDAVSGNVETELKKIGLRLINVNVTDINDESGYIVALGKEAAAKAINDAKISVAEADRNGAIGSAEADRDMRINVSKSNSEAIKGENEAKVQVAESEATRREREAEALKRATAAENIQAAKAINDAKVSVAEADRNGAIGAANAEKEQRIDVSRSNSEAIKGENEAKVAVAESEALRREREAEALKRATAAENIQSAKAMEESYAAQQAAEEARANLERAKLEADVLVKAEIRKKEIELQAEAEAEEIRRRAKGEADAIVMKMQAEAQGIRDMLTKQAEGLAEVVKASGGDASDAVRLMVADKLEELTKIQVEAISNLKIDKITVWDNGAGKDGKTSTANFLSGMMQAVPPMQELFDMAGMKLPEYLGKQNVEAEPEKDAE